jgi:hypothetical protein
MLQGTSGFINILQILPQHVSESGCPLQVDSLEATQAMSVFWAYTDYDPSIVASCRGMYTFHRTQTLLE